MEPNDTDIENVPVEAGKMEINRSANIESDPTDAGSEEHTNQMVTNTTKNTRKRSLRDLAYWLMTVVGLVWGLVMTILYIQERNDTTPTEYTTEKDTQIRSHGTLGMAAISHINVIVNDSIDIGAKYYEEILGFKPASNADGPMHYTNITNYGFCVDAGFEDGDCRVDIIFLKHEVMNLYLELFYYYEPSGSLEIPIFNTNDAGGIRHIAVEVEDAVNTYGELKSSDHQGQFITKDTPIPLDPFPYTFFYWIDKYGVQWEFEQGRPVEYNHIAGITG